MYCRNCGKEVHLPAVSCPSCGVPPKREKKFCGNCGVPTQPNQAVCTKCDVSFTGSIGSKSKLVAGTLGIILGALGIHKFYLGYKKQGKIMLFITLISIPLCFVFVGFFTIWIMETIGFIEGIIYFTNSDEDFDTKYVQGYKGWF
jgi:TM2 domain-containing membrane protein YozV